ncbi:hypothetical protein JX266_001563 [Neoarthrinium moseri]|nr:hypothetical protein JX266_001563 [Neoarthrinium moseri]
MTLQRIDPALVDALRAIAKSRGFSLNARDESGYVALTRNAQASVEFLLNLPDYNDPRLVPPVDNQGRAYSRPKASENPLNAWSHKTNITASVPADGLGLLMGRTIAIKDNMRVAGVPLTDGTQPFHLSEDKPYPIPQLDATIVSRVLDAGATITGTSTCENYCMSAMSCTSATGPVQNPWLSGYTSGGSSSGNAALLAIHAVQRWREERNLPPANHLGEGVDLALGADQGGSIRLPAAYCGVYGLKPTLGLVPYTGIEGLHPLCDHAGPMASSVRDTALLLSVIAGYDGFDPRMTPESPLRERVPQYHALLDAEIAARTVAETWSPTSAAKGLRVGILQESFDIPNLDPEVASIIRTAASRFAELGGIVEEVSIPQHAYAPHTFSAAVGLHAADTFLNPAPSALSYPFSTAAPSQNQHWYDNLTASNPQAVHIFLTGLYLQDRQRCPESVRAKVLSHVHELRAAYDEALARFDVLITPANPTPGVKHAEQGLGVKDKADFLLSNTLNTCPFNVSGHPALVIPVGWGAVKGEEDAQLPVGMQIVGRRWGEETLFLAAAAWEILGKGLDGART